MRLLLSLIVAVIVKGWFAVTESGKARFIWSGEVIAVTSE